MKNNFPVVKFGLLASITLAFNISAEEQHIVSKDFTYSSQDISELAKANSTILSDDQFVFNNELALLDWDNIFASYFPHLLPHQETIMHYAGYYSINPKLLISIAESKSRLATSPSKKSYLFPFGDLSNKEGFEAQIKDVANKLSKRFYAYRKLALNIGNENYVLLNDSMPSSAATIAVASLLKVSNQPEFIGTVDKRSKIKDLRVGLDKKKLKKNKVSITSILNSYENVFAETKDIFTQYSVEKLEGKSTFNPLSNRVMAQNSSYMPNLYLPWRSGWNWQATGGAHGYDGSSWPLSSLDFAYVAGNYGWGGDKPAVFSSHGGTVTWLSSCQMRVTHSSGLATNYYHMDNLQYRSGSKINAGTYIGEYANTKGAALCEGGQSSGPHLHISLMKNGYWESMQGYAFSGYYIQVGTSNYDNDCNRSYLWKGGYKTCHRTNIYKPYE